MRPIAWPTLIDALARVEAAPANEAGMLTFGGVPGAGGIFVEKGRVCWVFAAPLRQRLRDLLQASPSARDVDLDQVYDRCRAEGRVLGQTLVEEGWIAPAELEAALRRHSAESLLELCRGPQPQAQWSSRGALGYWPQFTFRALDVLLDVAALDEPDVEQAARAELAHLEPLCRRGGAYRVDLPHEGPVPVAAFGSDLTVHALRSLGTWALAVPKATRELGLTPSFTLAATTAGEAIAVWWRFPLLFAVACEDRRTTAAIAAHHLQGPGS